MIQGGQLPPNLLATKPMVARPINTAPIKIAHSFMALYPLILTSGLFLRRMEAGVTSTNSSSLI